MFKKKECSGCKEKISDKYEFCPYCGNSINGNYKKEDFGMLGKNDNVNEFNQFSNSMLGGLGGGILNKMIGNAMKMLENEMKNEMKKEKSPVKTNFQLFINGKKVNLNNGGNQVKQKQVKKIEKKDSVKLPAYSEKNQKKFSSLPKEEPQTNVRRFSNRIIYEIKTPGVKTIEDLSIIKLENSIEIKAIGTKKAYIKLISINFPIVDYSLSKGKLILELETNE